MVDETQAPLLDHLIELRTRLVRCFAVLAVAFGVCFYFAEPIFGFLVQPLVAAFPEGDGKLVFTKLYEAFFVDIKVEKHSRDNARALQEALAAMPEVVACHMVSGTADFMAEIVVANLKAYERLLTDRLLVLPMIGDIRSNFALTRVKSDAALPLTHLKRETSGREPDC